MDTDIALDFMLAREPQFADTRKLMLLGYLKEAELWISGAQVNALLYVLTRGGKPAHNKSAQESLKKLLRCVHVYQAGEQEIAAVLDSTWPDLEDAWLHQAALNLKADYLITRNQKDFALSTIKVFDAVGLFAYLKEHQKIEFEEINLV